jgi:putative tricarboxylic transport membrane protein
MTRLRNPGNLIGGLVMIALALFTFWHISDLEVGRAMRMGPGYFPRLLAILIAAMGVLLVAISVFSPGPRLERWSLGKLALVLGSIIVFGLTIRPLGLVLSGAILIVLSTLAAPDSRWKETAIFGVALLAFVTLLFPVALGLPLAIWPRF